MPDESNAEKVRRIVGELARIRNELKELVREGSGAGGGDVASARRGAGEDPLEEILGGVVPALAKNALSLNPEDEDVIVVDVLGSGVGAGVGVDGTPTVAPAEAGKAPAEALLPNSEKRAKDFPKKPPPRKRK